LRCLLGLLCLFMRPMRATPVAILLKLKLAFNLADIFVAPIIEALAFRTLEADEIILWHIFFKF